VYINKDLNTVVDIKEMRLEWTGRVVRMDLGRTVKKIFESKPQGVEEREDLDRDG
jgi:hypothetical protein